MSRMGDQASHLRITTGCSCGPGAHMIKVLAPKICLSGRLRDHKPLFVRLHLAEACRSKRVYSFRSHKVCYKKWNRGKVLVIQSRGPECVDCLVVCATREKRLQAKDNKTNSWKRASLCSSEIVKCGPDKS